MTPVLKRQNRILMFIIIHTIQKETGNIYLNEINTLPGFTNISMYPKMWEYMGLDYSELLDTLIELGFERYETKHKLTIKE